MWNWNRLHNPHIGLQRRGKAKRGAGRYGRVRLRLLAAAAAMLFAAGLSAARAESMMKPGPSPEAGLAGVWRIIGASAAPWSKPHALNKTNAPLLEYAVDFEAGEVKGPPPLACRPARYSSGVQGIAEMFAGRLAGASGEAMAKSLHLSSPSTWRIFCGAAVREYYVDDDADLVMAQGDVVYLLERPTGGDPEQYKAGYSGPSFDCTQAKTTGDRLLCRDAHLSKLDRRLGAAFSALGKSESASSFATMRDGQRAWLSFTMKSCGADGAMPESAGDRSPIIECLDTAWGERADLFDGVKVHRAGALVLEPRLRFRTRARPNTEESDIYPWMSGGPQAALFNAFIFKTLKLAAWRMDDATVFRFGDVGGGDMRLHARRSYGVERFDGRVVSLAVSTSDYAGGHDEERGETALNWQMGNGRLIRLDDVFAKGAPWRKFATDYCMRSLRKQLAEDNASADLDASLIAATVASGGAWLWGKDKAVVIFTLFMNAGMPAAEYEVDIPYAALKPFMRPDAPPL